MELREDYQEFTDRDAEILAISVDDLSGADYVVDHLGIQFPILYDPSTEVSRQYGVYNLLRDNLATPAVFVIDKRRDRPVLSTAGADQSVSLARELFVHREFGIASVASINH